ncbi:hypothetical protein V2J09_005604 [Rumex salicifolius]
MRLIGGVSDVSLSQRRPRTSSSMAASKNLLPSTQQNHLQQWRSRRFSSAASLIFASCSLLTLSLLVLFFHPPTATTFTSSSTTININILSFSSQSTTTTGASFAAAQNPRNDTVSRTPSSLTELKSCDVFNGSWVMDRAGPLYPPGSCPNVDDAFNCFNNGRPDHNYLYYRWKPRGCEIPRFDGRRLLNLLRNKRVVFVGDSLNRNMWQSLICSLRHSEPNSSSLLQISHSNYFSYLFKDYNCTIEYIKSPFLVQRWRVKDFQGKRIKETLRLDLMQEIPSYVSADIIVFNTGHWWTHHKTKKGIGYFQEGEHVHSKLKVEEAFKRALKTWARYVDNNNNNGSLVFFSGYSASHFRGGRWNSGGGCDGETRPVEEELKGHVSAYRWMMEEVESVISRMEKHVTYLNITRMTEYRRDAHPSVFRHPPGSRRGDDVAVQDCSHWCLPGVPDSWNHLFYAYLLIILPLNAQLS